MKYSLSPPPMGGEDQKERLDMLSAWLYQLNEILSVVLENLGVENFNSETKEILEEGRKDQ